MLRVGTWQSNIALQRVNTIGCRRMASELLRRQVAVIVALGTPSALAAKTATAIIPIVFSVTEDPVKLGLVASVNRPGGNATGVSYLLSELAPKQLGLLRELVPAASRFGLLVNPKNENAKAITSDLKAAAAAVHSQCRM